MTELRSCVLRNTRDKCNELETKGMLVSEEGGDSRLACLYLRLLDVNNCPARVDACPRIAGPKVTALSLSCLDCVEARLCVEWSAKGSERWSEAILNSCASLAVDAEHGRRR